MPPHVALILDDFTYDWSIVATMPSNHGTAKFTINFTERYESVQSMTAGAQ